MCHTFFSVSKGDKIIFITRKSWLLYVNVMSSTSNLGVVCMRHHAIGFYELITWAISDDYGDVACMTLIQVGVTSTVAGRCIFCEYL